MDPRAFHFRLRGGVSWATSFIKPDPRVSLMLNAGAEVRVELTPDEARTMATALIAAAHDSEARLPTGLGESEAA